jgi:hypothetical protein
MNNKLIIIIVAIVIVVGVVGIIASSIMPNTKNLSDINTSAESKAQIKVESDTNFNGTITLYTYHNLKKNDNGNYNMTEFYKSDKGAMEYHGHKIEIPIINGKATYDIPENAQFFIINPRGHCNERFNSENQKISVYFYSNGGLISQSDSIIKGSIFEIDFGDIIYDLQGNIIEYVSTNNIINNNPSNNPSSNPSNSPSNSPSKAPSNSPYNNLHHNPHYTPNHNPHHN